MFLPSTFSKRIETLAFGCLLFAIGIRPGTVLEQPEYAGTGQVFKWKVHIHAALFALYVYIFFNRKQNGTSLNGTRVSGWPSPSLWILDG
jgi:hypothetical protein